MPPFSQRFFPWVSPWQRVWRSPAFTTSLTPTLWGHYGTVEELAATGYGVPVFGIIIAIAGVFGLGSSTLASRLLGEGNETRIRNVTSFALYSALACGVVVAIAGFLFADPVTGLMGASGASLNRPKPSCTCSLWVRRFRSACLPWNSWCVLKVTPNNPCTALSGASSSTQFSMFC